MIRLIFKNLHQSEITQEIATARIEEVIEKFPDLKQHQVRATLSMENSPFQAGRDAFTVRILISGRRYACVAIQKSAMNLYAALADVIEHTLERLNRYRDKNRVKRRTQARRAQAYSLKRSLIEA